MRLRTICVAAVASSLTLATGGAQASAKNKTRISSGGAAYAPTDAVPPIPVAAPPAAEAPPAAVAPGASPAAPTGGQAYGMVAPPVAEVTVPGMVAKILPSGFAAAPAAAPAAVQQAIFAANQIVGRPYVYGGGHQAFISSGYDCSGTVSFALHGANLLVAPLASGDFMSWGVRGAGQWITVYSNSGHAYMTIAGIRLDTSTADDPSRLPGPRWRPLRRSNRHFKVRSLPGL